MESKTCIVCEKTCSEKGHKVCKEKARRVLEACLRLKVERGFYSESMEESIDGYICSIAEKKFGFVLRPFL